MEGQEGLEEESRMTDNDLNAIEAWSLGSTHPLENNTGDTKAALIELFKTNRTQALTPRNVLDGVHTIEEENMIRSTPYKRGILLVFGGQYAFGYDYHLKAGKLNPDGTSSEVEFEILKDGKHVDYSQLRIDPEFEEFYQSPIPTESGVSLKFKDEI